jgi:predicted Zn-dependent protease
MAMHGRPLILILTIAVLSGCRTLSKFRPADQQVIACREQSRLGLDALGRGHTVEAEARLLHAIRGCPHDAEARRALSQVYWAQERTDEAIAQMDAAVRLSGDDPLWTVELGRMLLANEKPTVSEECCRRALARNPDLGPGWALLGDIYCARGSPHAVHAYHRALASSGSPPDVLLSLSHQYASQGRTQRALAMLRQFEDRVGIDHCPADLARRKGILLQAMQRHEEALAEFQVAEQQEGRDDQLLRLMAASYQDLGQWGPSDQALTAAGQLQSAPLQTAALMQEVAGESVDRSRAGSEAK